MDWTRIEGNWKQVKGTVKERWGRLVSVLDQFATEDGFQAFVAGRVNA